MATPRRKQAYTPAMLENLRYRYEETGESIVDIAATIAKSHTHLRDLAREHGWTKYAPPPLDITPAARLAAEAEKLAAEAARLSSTLPPRSGGEGRLGVREHGEAGWGDSAGIEKTEAAQTPLPPTPDPSPSLAGLAGGGEDTALPTTAADLSNLAPDARRARLSEMASGLDFQLALVRQRQAYPQRNEDRRTINAEFNRLVATAAIIEHQLEKLEGGRTTPLPDEINDDIPDDIDAFRLRLAARIEEFLQRRPDLGDGDGHSDP